ncbi:MAG: hypothetical protein CSA20_01690 [Deltaproteobacteria bacterium]|nr:MAG: hypothetical protein CSA20_01690 [Deltaproteobacteria bacterium]
MQILNMRLCFIVAMLVAILIGCSAGKKEFQYGQQLAEADKYKEAVAYLEQAIEKEPNNKEYRAFLASLQDKVVDYYGRRIRAMLQTASALTHVAINDARSELDQAREIAPDHEGIALMEREIQSREQDLLGKVREHYKHAEEAMSLNEWDKAFFFLQQIQSVMPNYEQTSQYVAQVRAKGSAEYIDAATSLFKKERFEEAMSMARKAMAVDPSNNQARQIYAQAEKNNGAEYFVEQAREATHAKDWNRAIACYKRALTFIPEDSHIPKILEQLKMKALDAYVERATTWIQKGWLLRGYQDYNNAIQYLPDGADNFSVNNLRMDLVQKMAVIAERFKDEGRYGAAWYWYQKVKDVDPTYPEIFFALQAMEDNIRQRVQKSIAVFDFNNPTESGDAGVIVASNLITFLFNNASGDIKILERENLKSILEEMKLGQIGVVSAQTAQAMGKVYGIDVAIMGSVLRYKVDAHASKGVKTLRYKTGTRIEDNIAYLNWKARNPHPNEDELKKAPPAKIVVPEYAEKDYQVSRLRKVGFVELSFRIVDVRTGENIQVKTVERKQAIEDESSAGVAEAGVRFDPLEIATDTELLQNLTAEVVSELGREALAPLRNLEKSYYDQGLQLLKRRQNLDAAEKFIDAIFDERLKRVTHSPITANAAVKVDEIFANYNTPLQ